MRNAFQNSLHEKMTRTRKANKCIKHKRASYSIVQKNQVITYAKQHGQNKVANYFQLDASMIGCWLKASENQSTKINQDCKRIGSGRKALYPEVEGKLYAWVIEQRKQILVVI